MQVLGIIAEYNPFHNGHLYHLESAKKSTQSDYTLAVMSPNFVQRGQPAITDKWSRTKMALLSGIDMVIELPTPYATASAEYFSHAGISLLKHTGIVNNINFGSETSNLDLLKQIAGIFTHEPLQFKESLKTYLGLGMTFPKAREKALLDYAHTKPKISPFLKEIQEIIRTPNNILGLEYLKALKKLKSPIKPSILLRKGSQYHQKQITGQMSSATAIRDKINKNQWQDLSSNMPQASYHLLDHNIRLLEKHISWQDLSTFLRYRLIFSSPSDLQNIVGVTEGVENRILNNLKSKQTIGEIADFVKTKRLTQSAVDRMLLSIVLQLKKDDFQQFQNHGGPQYIRILGFKKSSSFLLKKLKKQATLPLVLNPARDYESLSPLGKKMFDIEVRSSNIYTALENCQNQYNLDFTHPLVITP